MITIKIGKLGVLLFLLSASVAHAVSTPQFSASVDRTQIGIDEAVSLKLQTRSEGSVDEEEVTDPTFLAPDFDVVNEFSSQSMQSFYNNGQFGMQSVVTLTKILKPKRTGMLKIFDISATIGGRKVPQPPITIEVLARSIAPQRRGGDEEDAEPLGRSASHGFFVRAEVNDTKIVTGQQVIVSYYLYRRVQLFNIAVDKFPVLSGFLREDLEMPIQGSRLESDPVMVGGVPYQRSLLVRYAAYPLKEGRLPIDPLGLKFNYYTRTGGSDEDDPMMGFFRQMTPLAGTAKSDPVIIEVSPLPGGRPAQFSGAVGSFEMVATIDKPKLKVGEPLTVVLKVEGRGNLSGVETPPVQWPEGVQIFDSKGRTTTKGLHAEKIFEYVVIPKKEGQLEVPSIEVAYFDPTKGSYSVLKSEVFRVEVQPGDGQADAPAVTPDPNPLGSASMKLPSIPKLNLRLVFGVVLLAILLGVALRWWVEARRREKNSNVAEAMGESEIESQSENVNQAAEFFETKKSAPGTEAHGLRAVLDAAESGQGDLLKQYDRLGDLIYSAIDRRYDLAAKTRSRSELAQLLKEQGLDPATWKKISEFFEFAENARFGVGSQNSTEARQSLRSWALQVGELIQLLSR